MEKNARLLYSTAKLPPTAPQGISPVSNAPWSSPHSHLLVLLSVKLHKYGDLGADWQARSGLQCSVDFAGQIKVLGRISLAHGLYFWRSCHRKLLGVVRRTNVSLYVTVWCCNCFVAESRIWNSYTGFVWVFSLQQMPVMSPALKSKHGSPHHNHSVSLISSTPILQAT